LNAKKRNTTQDDDENLVSREEWEDSLRVYAEEAGKIHADSPLVSNVPCPRKVKKLPCGQYLIATIFRDDMRWVQKVTFACPSHGPVKYHGPFPVEEPDKSESEIIPIDPIFKDLPPELMTWLTTQSTPIHKLMARYGWSQCPSCNNYGIAFSSDRYPSSDNLEFETCYNGHLHPRVKGEVRVWLPDKSSDHITPGLLFDKFMRAINNSMDFLSFTFVQMDKGATDSPFSFCISPRAPVVKRASNKQRICPKCGEPGSGLGHVRRETRFFHEPGRSCYIGMVDGEPRKKAEEIMCQKCGLPGKQTISKGYVYVHHGTKTCYIGKTPSPDTLVKSVTRPAPSVHTVSSHFSVFS
jgi:hypothetical protein